MLLSTERLQHCAGVAGAIVRKGGLARYKKSPIE